MPDSAELRMLEALVAEAVRCARTSGFCVERFHGWEITVTVSTAAGPARATLAIHHHGVAWQRASWVLGTSLAAD
ncbi:hypothetical protein WI25_28680 [Burkholderia cepacia]|nr:hypothetical protein WI25_28680 [Burkholderia cepacia]